MARRRVIQVCLPAELEPEVTAHREQLQKAAPVGRIVGDSAAVVDLVARGLRAQAAQQDRA